jgi:hypothetical protein
VEDLNVRIPQIVAGLPRYAAVAAERIRALQHQVLDPQQASHVMLRAAQRGVIGWSLLKRLAEEWDKPSVPELTRGTKWSMLNALTHVAKQRQAERPVDAARMTMRFQEMLIAA